jgi:hypothetical protein
MMIMGVDYHPSFQTMAFLVEETGECGEQELHHSDGQAEKFYRDLKERGIDVRVGMEATGYSRWFERLLAELGFELWIGDPAEIKAKRVKKKKNDREDARLMRKLLLGRSVSSNLGAGSREPGSATTVVAPASVGAFGVSEGSRVSCPPRRNALSSLPLGALSGAALSSVSNPCDRIVWL